MLSQTFSEMPQNYFFEEFTVFLSVSRIIYPIPLFMGHIFLKDFPIYLICFLLFLIRIRFSEKALNYQFVDRISFFPDPFPRMFGLFPRMFGLFPVLNSQFVNQFPTVVGDYINTMKTTVDFNFDFNQSAKQHG